jgi:prophage regulatory protein
MKLIDFKSLGPAKGINYSRDHLRRKCKAGEFPKPIPLSRHRIAWIEAEVDEWLADRARARSRYDLCLGEVLPRIAAKDFVDDVAGDSDRPGYLLQANVTDAKAIRPPSRNGAPSARA